MSLLADLLSSVFERRHKHKRLLLDDRSMSQLTKDLVGTKGEISGIILARQILNRFGGLDDDGKLAFFRLLAEEMDVNAERVTKAAKDYSTAPGKATYQIFLAATEPPRQELIRRLNQVPGATKNLVGMRADLLRLGRKDDRLMALDLDFRHLFASWFNRGFLVLRPMNWESPASILEKIIAYEAVHAIDSWGELRRRLEPDDRRCFAFFHPAMPDEPLIFVAVALTRGIPNSIQQLLENSADPIDIESADAAVFYSISNCQTGLTGISFGQSLIKQVATDLSLDLPGLKTFVTLSPVPGFSGWLKSEGIRFNPKDGQSLRKLAAYYLLEAKRSDGLPVDPVARFHLGNGAMLHAVHADADISPNGKMQSEGVMVNYLYVLERTVNYHEKFASTKEVVASTEVQSLSSDARVLLNQETKK